MTRRGWLRLMAAGVLVVWLCLFLHWDNTEKSMIRALLVETSGDGWTVGLLYQFPEASADSSEAKAAIRLCMGRGPELSSAISAAEEALPQRADWRLCEYLLAGQDSVRLTLSACEELFLHRPYGRLASRVFGRSFSVETLKERADESDVLPENLLQCIKNAALAAPRLYQQSSGFILPVVELEDEDAHYRPEALIITPEQTGQLTESQTEMALLLQGKSWTDTGEHRFALEAGPLRLRRAFCGVEREGERFLLRVNALSRRLCAGPLPPEKFRQAVEEVRNAPAYPDAAQCAMYAVISAAFSVFFGGTLRDAATAAVSGMLLFGALRFCQRLRLNGILQSMLASALAALAVMLMVGFGLGQNPDKIIIGNIMLLIPGIALTTSLRDMINGDTISGLLGLSEAVLKALAIAIGFAAVLMRMGG